MIYTEKKFKVCLRYIHGDFKRYLRCKTVKYEIIFYHFLITKRPYTVIKNK